MATYNHEFQDIVFSRFERKATLVHFGLKEVTGSINGAIWLSQILYWYNKGWKDGEIFKSRRELAEEIGLSRDQQIVVERKLKQLGIVSILVKPGLPSPINHISINFDVLLPMLDGLPSTLKGDSRTSKVKKPVIQAKRKPENITENTNTDDPTEYFKEYTRNGKLGHERIFR